MKITSVKTLTISAVLLFGIKAYATCVPEPHIGSICLTAGSYCPPNYIEADGRALEVWRYYMLYSLIGDEFGGNGRSTFAIPDMRGRVPVGLGKGAGLKQTVSIGQYRGSEAIRLSKGNLPKHSHEMKIGPYALEAKMTASVEDSNQVLPGQGSYIGFSRLDALQASWIVDSFSSTMTNPVALGGVNIQVADNAVTTEPVGDNQPVDSLPPQIGLRYCIAYEGIYPGRN